ncbi:MAG: tetratricopeptide repeat protein [Alphaproteobacteria bacterium]|nr:tetratricopeptide repeat protein [Alphaproteobacteria bacterium]HPF47553.1 tetratricopeptide repeat protein [Emcibacteraceae bacterium]
MTKHIEIKAVKKTVRALMLGVCLIGFAACSSPEEVKQSHYERGMELLADQDMVKASIEFRNALQIDDTFVPAWYGMSLVEEKNEQWGKVIVLLNKVIELDPTNIEAHTRLGTLLLMVGELDKAVEVSEAALLIDNQNPEVLALRGATLLKLEDAKGAVEFANKALAIDPANLKAIQILAAERFAAGDFDGALKFINDARDNLSENKDLMQITILIYETKGDIDKAEEVYKDLVAAYPDDQKVHLSLVNFYIKHNNTDAAEREVRAIAAADPTDYEKNINVVRFLNSYRNSAAAEAELNTLIERGVDVVRYQLALAEFYLSSGKKDDAKTVLKKIVDRTGSSEDGLIARSRLGQIAIDDGNIEEASDIIAEILAIDSKNVSALEMRGGISLAKNDYDNAIQDLRIVLSETPDSVRASLLLSRAYELSGSIELADDTFADALRYSNENPSVAVAYAEFLVKQSAAPRAEQVLIEALKVNTNNVELLKSLAQIKLMRQDWSGAQDVANVLEQVDKDDEASTEIKGFVYRGQRNYDQSIESFRNAYSNSGGASRPLNSLITAYIQAGKVNEAKTFLNNLIADDDNNYQALVLLGQVNMVSNNNDEAEKAFNRAIEVDPTKDTAFSNLAAYYIRQDNLDEAMKVIDRGISSVENNTGLNLYKANLYEREKDYDRAIAVYEDMYAQDATVDIVVNNLASLLSEHRTDNESMQRAQQLAARFRQSAIPHFKDTLGWIYYKVGDIQNATSVLQDVVEKMPNNVYFRYHLGMSYMAGDRNAAAAREFEEVVKLAENQPFEQLDEVKGLLADLKP